MGRCMGGAQCGAWRCAWSDACDNTFKERNLLSASAKALRVCNGTIDYNVSFIDLHKVCDRATPEMYMK